MKHVTEKLEDYRKKYVMCGSKLNKNVDWIWFLKSILYENVSACRDCLETPIEKLFCVRFTESLIKCFGK